MTKYSEKKQAAIRILASLQIDLAKVSGEFEESGHKSTVVRHHLDAAGVELFSAYHFLFNDAIGEAIRLSQTPSLRIAFAKQLLNAENVEHTFGESDYLELSTVPPSAELLLGYLQQFEAHISKLESKIRTGGG